MLEVDGLSKSYPGVQALRGVSLRVQERETVGLVGENGAGKSTLLDVLSGVTAPDEGRIALKGSEVAPRDYHHANELGIFRVFQRQAMIPGLSIYENLFLSHERRFTLAGVLLDRRAMRRRADELLRSIGIEVDVTRPASAYDHGQRQAIEIGRVVVLADLLDIELPLILLDEPTTALDQDQDETFLQLVESLSERASLVFVSHRLTEILRVCDRVYVLKDGELVSDGPADALDEPRLHALMVGRTRAVNYYREDDQGSVDADDTVLLGVRDLSLTGAFEGVSFDLHAGEVLGIGGLLGSGKVSVGQAIAGVVTPTGGSIALAGAPEARPDLRSRMDAGVAFVPGDRQQHGLIAEASVLANFQLASLHDRLTNRLGIWASDRARAEARRYVAELEVFTRGIGAPADSLSGGNQQKLVLAKWLSRSPRVLVLDAATQGVDTGAREAIYRLIRRLAAGGMGVIVITDDLPELIGLSNRIAVLVSGRLAHIVDAPADEKPTEEEIVALMSTVVTEAA
jgi:ribose transport system ATP-binding protein